MTKRGRKAKDNKGYLDTNKQNHTPYKVIKGNKITMEGVSGQIYAIPIDSKGNAGAGRLMKPGENHEFEGASQIIEVPEVAMAQIGGNFGQGWFNAAKNVGQSVWNGIRTGSTQPEGLVPPLQPIDDNNSVPQPTTTNSQLDFYNHVQGQPTNNPLSETPVTTPPPTTPTTPSAPILTAEELASYGEDATMVGEQNELNNLSTFSEGLPENPSEDFLTKQNEKSWQEYLQSTANRDGGVEPTEKIQFDNPYGGVDIPTAAQTLGASLSYDGDQGGANTMRGVASGLKLLTGLGRNVMSGYAQNKRNQWNINEYNQNQKDTQRRAQSLQEGGEITDIDTNIINDSTGLNFTQDMASDLFAHVIPEQQATTPEIDFGRYNRVGYFETGEMQNGKRVIYNTARNPMNYVDNERNALDYLRELNGDNFVFKYINNSQAEVPTNAVVSRQRGGEVTASDLLSGAYTTGDPTQMPNVEVEGGEHIKDNRTGQVQEVKGKKHSQGGEQMNLEDHKVLSDFTKIGGTKAKQYRDEFDIKVKAKDTYATVMDKVLKKTGYKSMADDLSKTIEQTEKEQERTKEVDDKATSGINLQFLSGKINDITKQMEPLEEMKSVVFERLFEDQQGEKSQSEIQSEGESFKFGGNASKLAQQYGISPDRAKELIRSMQTGGESRSRFKSWVDNLRMAGFEGEVNLDAEDIDAEVGKVQAWMRENKPEAVISYFTESGQPITAKGVDLIKANNPETFSKAGIDSNKPSASYTEEEKQALTNVMKEDGTFTNEFILEQFNDNKFAFRAPLVAESTTDGIERIENEPATLYRRPNTTNAAPIEERDWRDSSNEDGNRGTGNSTLFLPNQHIMPPSAMQPHRLSEVSPREAEASLVSPQAQIEEINRQFVSAKDSINSLPDSQRRAALAQLNTTTQQQINQAMSQANQVNAQIQNQTDQFNAQVANQAELTNENAAQSYEQNTLIAKDKTEQDIRNYFNALNRRNIANYNTVQNLNLTNAMYDNFQYNGQGQVVQTGKAPDAEELMETTRWFMSLTPEQQEEVKKERETTSKKTTAKAKRGRKIK